MMAEVWIDANVIVRALAGDHPKHSPEAQALALRAEEGRVRLRIAALVVAETVWVLGSVYGHPRERISKIFLPFLATEGIEPDEAPIVTKALVDMASKKVDFVDAYLAARAAAAGQPVCTFDADFERLAVEALRPGDVK